MQGRQARWVIGGWDRAHQRVFNIQAKQRIEITEMSEQFMG
jgi:hypothetical protein